MSTSENVQILSPLELDQELLYYLLVALEAQAHKLVAYYNEIDAITIAEEDEMMIVEDIEKLASVAHNLYPFKIGYREDLAEFLLEHWPWADV